MGAFHKKLSSNFRGGIGWMAEAACAGSDTEQFFCDPWTEKEKLQKVLQTCFSCPVINQCLSYAVDNRLEGVWGGTTETERTKLVSKRRRS